MNIFQTFRTISFSSLNFTLALIFLLFSSTISQNNDFTLTILHTNDVHSRVLETDKYSSSCTTKDKNSGLCYGGFSRIFHKVNEIRKNSDNVLFLSAGDYFQGTIWYTLFKWTIFSKFLNDFNHTAMAFGNHEFDDGIDELVSFINNSTFPIISSNIDAKNEERLKDKFTKSMVIERGGRKIGIIGYTTIETPEISRPGPTIIFEDERSAVEREAQKLHENGVNILIALGHAGYDVDMRVALIPIIDVVVGGHTNTFLFSGKSLPDIEEPLGEYPTVIIQENGRKVPVVQAYAFGKYLGFLNVSFDDKGEVISWAGNPILLDSSVPQDVKMEAEIQEAGEKIINSSKKEVGKTRVFLDGGQNCRLIECNLGNIIADAMVQMNIKFPDDLYWSRVTMAIINGGSVRSSIEEKSNNGSITLEDILTVLPFQNTIDIIEIEGKYLRQAFEHSISDYDPKGFRSTGKFLQVSGIRVVYDLNRNVGEKVIKLDVLCKKCRVPEYGPLNDSEIYQVAIPTYVATGGDGYSIIKNNMINHHLSGILDTDMFLEYLETRSPLTQGVDGRVRFYKGDNFDKNMVLTFIISYSKQIIASMLLMSIVSVFNKL